MSIEFLTRTAIELCVVDVLHAFVQVSAQNRMMKTFFQKNSTAEGVAINQKANRTLALHVFRLVYLGMHIIFVSIWKLINNPGFPCWEKNPPVFMFLPQ